MPDIYDQHTAAFSRVSAFVVLDTQGERVATVALKFPADGAGRLYAYVHLIGCEMTRGWATGYGYDKRSPAVEAAVERIKLTDRFNSEHPRAVELAGHMRAMKAALGANDGEYWDRRLEKAGYRVLQAV